ncbi:hypothetical protein CXB49_14175 [Chromobacterium sp. ATCC 53434]|uniref:hypothetical protein n=1 Tax=Chromobacterium TaxID=535 RepID=UPI000C759494|nr:hypothetical protein [Chromobacterium sp. ATCC 53434]AUH51886.1 hypothetical protein CXB49_14175 [Chromobacterium sp. ATCC 53434]
MDVLHSTWFWVAVIVAPIATVAGILARLAKREPPPDLPPGVKPLAWDDADEDVAATLHDGDKAPPKR